MWNDFRQAVTQLSRPIQAVLAVGVVSLISVGAIGWRVTHGPQGKTAAISSAAIVDEGPQKAVTLNTARQGAHSGDAEGMGNAAAPIGAGQAETGAKAGSGDGAVAAKAEDKTGDKASGAAAASAVARPAFDVARVEPDGATLVAGRAQPGSVVDLIDGGKSVAQVTADANGQFVILPGMLAPGAHQLTLAARSGGAAAVASEQGVTVVVPQNKKDEVIVALSAPGEVTKILSDKAAPAAPSSLTTATAGKAAPATPSAQEADPQVRIRSVESGEGGMLFASGSGPAGAEIRLYLNGTFVAKVTAAPDHHWSLKVERGMTPGAYQVRADAVGANGQVLARAEVPFNTPLENSALAAPKPKAAATSSGTGVANAGTASTGIASPAATPSVTSEKAPETAAAAPAAPASSATGSGPASNQTVATQPAPVTQAGGAQASTTTPAQTVASLATPAPETSKSAETAGGSGADAVIAQLDTAKVSRGDSLWRISRKIYGRGMRYTEIYEANTKQIRDPKLIYPGQVFVLPADKKP